MENEDIMMRNQELAHKNQILEKENIELKAQISILFKLIENMNKPVYLPTPVEPQKPTVMWRRGDHQNQFLPCSASEPKQA